MPEVSLDELARLHVVRGGQLMWLIGAGASAAAGVPTAGQMIDEFRQLIYATVHGIPLVALSLAEPAIRDRIERFFAGHPDYPDPGDPAEYSALFKAAWDGPADRRSYLEGKLVVGKPAFGNFGLAVLAAVGRAPVVWTPNFDRVYERAAELVLEPPAHLTVATLDTSKIAAAAPAGDRFPLYVKLHGDYQSDLLKNTSEELREQDALHRTALVQATQRYGLIVAGYSGRDASLMATLTEAVNGATPFPAGLFWCRRPSEDSLPAVTKLLETARDRGVDARWVIVHTFDELLGQLLLTCDIPSRMQDLLDQACPPKRREPFTLPVRRGSWPVVRLNCLPLLQFPLTCRQVVCSIGGTAAVRAALQATRARAVATRRSTGVIAFGHDEDLRAALGPYGITSWATGSIIADRLCRDGSGDLGLLYDALTEALARERPVAARRSSRAHYLIVDPGSAADPTFAPLRGALTRLAGRRRDLPGGGALAGRIGTDGPAWAEALRLRLEYHYDTLWLVFEPTVWIEKTDPGTDLRSTFTGPRTWHRYNPVADQLLDAWTQVLHGANGRCSLYGIPDDQGIDTVFELGDRTAFTRRQGR